MNTHNYLLDSFCTLCTKLVKPGILLFAILFPFYITYSRIYSGYSGKTPTERRYYKKGTSDSVVEESCKKKVTLSGQVKRDGAQCCGVLQIEAGSAPGSPGEGAGPAFYFFQQFSRKKTALIIWYIHRYSRSVGI